MSQQNDPISKKNWLSRFGLWTGMALVAGLATAVFALVACKGLGSSRW
jgi:hypothetical protein